MSYLLLEKAEEALASTVGASFYEETRLPGLSRSRVPLGGLTLIQQPMK